MPIASWQLAGFLFTSIAGTFLHFLFDLSGQNFIAALFSAVNESIWEHLKLIYYPMLLFSLAEYRVWGKQVPNFWCVKLSGMLFGLILIPVTYYTYSGILGKSIDLVNIAIFFLAAGAVFRLETGLFQRKSCGLSERAAIFLLLLIGIIVSVWTFYPPRIPFFQDPQSGNFGFWK